MICRKEQTQQKTHSPGVVADNECLLRHVYSPEHYQNGALTEGAFPSEDFKKPDRGFSVNRKLHVTHEFLEKLRDKQIEKKAGRALEGIAAVRCCDVRYVGGEKQTMCVIDDGCLENPAHALILCAEHCTPSGFNKLRRLLVDMCRVISLDEAASREDIETC